ncbi:hypothetical protein [Nonomuraea jabiensis]|uniref:Enoyl-CoA hydratase/carnithine racemase n=1 Tax=Nonomuraea jabiensis TaxID=882448 RepID=A0A7W9LI97_9ACTN|nr:hypothetical protein [Nonomuraea jabiensis]MBB5784739.1 enoyl-CoA hydratase/carnithine racemase [Nonomuraea jabiensis]
MNISSRTDFTEIEYEVADRIATVTLNRPERLNAFTFAKTSGGMAGP